MNYLSTILCMIILNFVSITNLIQSDNHETLYGDTLVKGTHNSYSGDLDGRSRGSIKSQLDKGLRMIEFDVHPYDKENIFKKYWSNKHREFTSFTIDEVTYMLDYRHDNGQVSINEFINETSNYSLKRVFHDNWSAKKREFTSFILNDKAFVLNFRPDIGQVSIDQFNKSESSVTFPNKYKNNWSPSHRSFTSISIDERAFILNFRKDMGQVSIDEFTLNGNKGQLSNMFKTTWRNQSREFTSVIVDNKAFLVSYRADNGQISIDKLIIKDESISLKNVYKDNWDASKGSREFTSFSAGEKAYIVNYTHSNGIVSIDEFFMGESSYELGQIVYMKFDETHRKVNGLTLEVNPSDEHPILYLYNFRKSSGLSSIDKIDLETPAIGHLDIGGEVDRLKNNPCDLELKSWIEVIASWKEAHPCQKEPILLMIEAKGPHDMKDYFRLWLPNDKVNNIHNVVNNVFGEENIRLLKSDYTEKNGIDGVDANTPLDELENKIILYIEPPSSIIKKEKHYENIYSEKRPSIWESYLNLTSYREGKVMQTVNYRDEEYSESVTEYAGNPNLYRLFRMGEGDHDEGEAYPDVLCNVVKFAVSDYLDDRFMDFSCPDREGTIDEGEWW